MESPKTRILIDLPPSQLLPPEPTTSHPQQSNIAILNGNIKGRLRCANNLWQQDTQVYLLSQLHARREETKERVFTDIPPSKKVPRNRHKERKKHTTFQLPRNQTNLYLDHNQHQKTHITVYS